MHLRGSRSREATSRSQSRPNHHSLLTLVLPSVGNMVFTLLVAVGLIWASAAGALPQPISLASTSTTTIAYQGRLADPAGAPISTTTTINFRLYATAVGGSALWAEAQTVQVTNGLFNVLLGSTAPIPQSIITGNSTLWLGIAVAADPEMSPRVQLGSVPYAIQALTVPDGSISSRKLQPTIGDAAVAIATGDSISLSTTHLLVPGTNRTIIVDVPSSLLITAMFDFEALPTGSTAAGGIRFDGTLTGRLAVFSSKGTRTVTSTTMIVNLDPGTHTIALIAYTDNSGTKLYGNTGYSYTLFSR
jgi:hypothetical protein